jgi:NAD(P)-dependent dehydrogenase (short-subunit alcohol dehydrogenase family)
MSQSGLFDLTGRTAAIIGGGSGIGEAVAVGVARHGASVIVLDADAAAASAVATSIGGDTGGAALDIRDGVAVRAALDGIARDRGRLDIVVCTPGINVRKPILQYGEDDFDHVVAVNLKGSFNVLQAAGRVMTGQRGGSIVLFSSIRAQVVEPGVVETPLTAPIKADAAWYDAYANKSALKRWARADEMVGPTLFLVSDAASYVTGTILFADGGWTAIDGRFTPPGM